MKVFLKQKKSTQVEQVLYLLVESGFAYISIWVCLSIVLSEVGLLDNRF